MTTIALMITLQFVEQYSKLTWRTRFSYGKNLLIGGHLSLAIAIDMSTELEVCFVAEPNFIREARIIFSFFLNFQHINQRFPCQLVWVYAWSGFCMGSAEDPSLTFFAMMHVKDQIPWSVFIGILQTPSDRISHLIHIIRIPCCQRPAKSEIFCFLVEVFY